MWGIAKAGWSVVGFWVEFIAGERDMENESCDTKIGFLLTVLYCLFLGYIIGFHSKQNFDEFWIITINLAAVGIMLWTVRLMHLSHKETTSLMKQDYSERIYEREIHTKEKLIQGLLSRYYNSKRVSYYPEQTWKNLNDLYREIEKAEKNEEKHDLLILLLKWEHIQSIANLYEIDNQVRDYYKIPRAVQPSIKLL